MGIEYNENKVLKYPNTHMLEYIGKTLLIEEGKMRTLVIGDLHLGYEESMRKNGVLIPAGMYVEMRKEFDLIFARIGNVDKIVILGDLKHSFGEISGEEWRESLGLFDYLLGKCEEIVVVKGNHDAIIGPIAGKRGIKVVDYLIIGEYAFVHGDRDFEEVYDKKIKTWVMGHAHPAIVISDGTKKEKYKCFLYGEYRGKKIIVLPSFFPLIEGTNVNDVDDGKELGLAWDFDLYKFKVGIVNDLEVLDFGELEKIK